MDEELLGRPSSSIRQRRAETSWRAGRLGPAALVVAILLTVVPLVAFGTATPADAALPGSSIALPEGFIPKKINAKGWVAGTNGNPRLLAIWKPDGSMTELVGSLNRSVLDFNDKGEILTSSNQRIEVWSASGSRVLDKPLIAGKEEPVYRGWGPDANNRTIGDFGWRSSVRANAVEYRGASAPTLITSLATVMAMAPSGLVFGQLDASPASYAYLDGSTVRQASGMTGWAWPVDLSSDGRLLFRSGSGTMAYQNGVAQQVTGLNTASAINDKGAIVGTVLFDPERDTGVVPGAIKAPTGKVTRLADILGTAQFAGFSEPMDMNDSCQMVGQGILHDFKYRYYWADITNCAGDVFKTELEVTDGAPVVNREFELTLSVISEADNNATDVALGFGGVGISGGDKLEVVSGPTPELTTQMAGRDTKRVSYRVVAKEPGALAIKTAVTAKRNGDPIAAQGTFDFDVATAEIGGQFFRTDNKGEWVKVGEPAPVRLRIVNETGDDLEQVVLSNVRVEPAEGGEGAGELEAQPRKIRGYLTGKGAEYQDWADFELRGTVRGRAVLKADVSGVDPDGKKVAVTLETPFEVRQDRLKIDIELDPEEYTFPDDTPAGEEPEPLAVTSTLTFTNTGEIPLEKIRLQDLDVVRTFSGQELYVTYKDGVMPDNIDPAILVERLEPGETSEPFITNWEATDDGDVTFKASASAVDTEGEEARSVFEKPWKAKPTKYLELTTEVVNPPGGDLLEAGTEIIVKGTVENLSNTASLQVGPLFPELTGNTGTMTLAYAPDDEAAKAPNPRFPVEPEPLELGPGERKNFQVRITTSYSEARAYGVAPSGGTRAEIRFEPWAVATELDGTETVIRTYDENKPGQEADGQVKATAEDLQLRVSIDDSVEMPKPNKAATVAAFLSGTVEGLYNAAIAGIYGVVDVVTMPVTFLVAAIEYQSKVWDSFTEEEKAEFLDSSTYLIAAVLARNYELGIKDGKELYNQVYDYVGQMLTETQNEWQTGDFTSTAETYGAFFSETIGSVAGPIVLTKMAQAPKAVAAIERAQIAIQARMEGLLRQVIGIRNIEGVLPLLRALESGTELSPGEIENLYGVTAAEIEVYKKLATQYGYLLTIRSRHASSIRWIEKFGAMLKPEAIKIKSVSELDVKLGYRLEDLGSIVFKKPEVLKTLPEGASGIEVEAAIKQFVRSKGFDPTKRDYMEAVKRVEKRIKEWDKHAAEYQTFNEQGHIKTDFNYTGNGITDTRSVSEKEKLTGFRMKETSPGSDEFVIELLDPKTGKYKRVTGDIDPIAFTHVDGTPLTEAEHKELVDALMNSPVGAEHPESATYTEGGLDFILDQFKPGEPGLQIGPDGARPRVVRFDKKRSYWVNERDYRLHWEGGFIGTSGGRNRAVPAPVDAQFGRVPLKAPVRVPSALPAATGVATVGRCNVEVLNQAPPPPAQGPSAVYVGADGILTQIGADGAEVHSPYHATCFSEGAGEAMKVAPTNQLAEPTRKDPARGKASLTALEHGADRAIAAGSTTVELDSKALFTSTGGSGFVAGQLVVVGAGTDQAETAEIASATGSTLTFTAPLASSHAVGDVVVMVRAADGTPVETPTTTTTTTTPGAVDPTAPAEGEPSPASAGAAVSGSLPRTGSDPGLLVVMALVLLAAGAAAKRTSRWGLRAR
jgi:hypothetical protein